MNTQGFQYLENISKQKSKLKGKGVTFPQYQWSDSLVQERIMRLGRENRDFEIGDDSNTLERVAIASLDEDICNKHI